jgi:hypothetical protein
MSFVLMCEGPDTLALIQGDEQIQQKRAGVPTNETTNLFK